MRLKIVLLFLLVCCGLQAQERTAIPMISGSITFDGNPAEPSWKSAAQFSLIMQTPVFGKEPTEETDFRLFFDDKYLYVSGTMLYNDISQISAQGKQRDYFSPNCDWFGILLDSFNDHRNLVAFFTNPNGLRFDATVQNDASNGFEDINLSWNTFWDVKTLIDTAGWYAEMRIPISSIRFQVENDTAFMGLSAFRYIPKKNESNTFPAVDPKHGEMAIWKASLAAPVFLAGIKKERPVYITPYATGGYERLWTLNETETAWEFGETPKLNAGLDAKIGLTNNLTLDLTLNTDFAQVEADDQQINLTRFSLYFPEKRPFFLEKSDVFSFDLLGGQGLFYSRNIGVYEGESVPIIGGARITGRINTWDIGLLNMQTASGTQLHGENFGVFRTKKSILNSGSYLGGMFTSRVGSDNNYNYAFGLDAVIQPFGNDYFTMRFAQTYQKGATNQAWSEDPSRILLRWERRNMKGLGYDFIYTWSGQEFNPGVGFELVQDYYAYRSIVKYGWIPENENSKLRTHNISNTSIFLYNSVDMSLQSIMSMVTWEYNTRRGYSGNFSLRYNREITADSLDFSISNVPPGDYHFFDISVMTNMRSGTRIGGMGTIEMGQFFDGWRISSNLQPKINVNAGLDINPAYRLDVVRFPKRDQGFINHILGIKTLWMINTKISFSTFIQYNTNVEAWFINARFRYNPREGNDFYIVYNEGLNTNIYRETPTLPISQARILMLKYTYTFNL